MFSWFSSKNDHERKLAEAVEAVNKSRGAIESVIGLPHILSREILRKRFGESVQPSSPEFAETGRSGSWTFPPAHRDIVARVKGDETGRLVLGLVIGKEDFNGLTIYTEWDRFKPVSEWRIELGPEQGELAQELYQRLLKSG